MKLFNKKATLTLTGLFATFLIAGIFGEASLYSQAVNTINSPSDYSSSEIKAVVIDDFENGTIGDDGWKILSTPKQFLKGEENKKMKKKNPVPLLEMKFMEGGPSNLAVDQYAEVTGLGKTKKKCLGMRFRFRYPGFNRIDVLPPPEVSWKDHKTPAETYNPSTGKNEQERGIQLPGRAKGISMWVQARNHNFTLEVWIKDWRGDTHRVLMEAQPKLSKRGSINFLGWRPMMAKMPLFMPQAVGSFPQTKYAKITRFVIRSAPEARAGEEVRIWFDQLKVLTDVYESNFDGLELDKGFGDKSASKSFGGESGSGKN